MRFNFLFLLSAGVLWIGGNLNAQTLKIHAIELYFPAYVGTGEMGNVQSFISNTKEPLLFQTNISQTNSRQLESAHNGFAFDFIFRNDDQPKHSFLVGFSQTMVKSDLFEVSGSFQDSVDVTSTYKVNSEYFYLHGGYRRVFRPDKKFQINISPTLKFGIPVSSRTFESISYSASGNADVEYKFFARQHFSTMLTLPVSLQLKLFGNVSMALDIQNGLFYQKLDGTNSMSHLTGSALRFIFKIRPN